MCGGWSRRWKRVAKDVSVTRARRAHRPAASKRRELGGAGRLGLRAVAVSVATSRPAARAAWDPHRPLRGRSSDPARPPPAAGGILPLLRMALRPVDTLGPAKRPANKSPGGSSGCPGKCSSLRRLRGTGPRPLGWAGRALAARAARRRLVAHSMTRGRRRPGEKAGSGSCGSQRRRGWGRGGEAGRATRDLGAHAQPAPRFYRDRNPSPDVLGPAPRFYPDQNRSPDVLGPALRFYRDGVLTCWGPGPRFLLKPKPKF